MRCWAFLAIDVVSSSHFGFLLIVVSKDRKQSTISTVLPLMSRGVIDHYLFCFRHIDLQVVVPTPVDQPVKFSATDCFVRVGDQAFYGSAV